MIQRKTPLKRSTKPIKCSALPLKRRVAKSKSSKLPKPRIWAKSRADSEFSRSIRIRDGSCQFPGCFSVERLQCSHYIGRARMSTRFDFDNCITLCEKHHYGDKQWGFEYQKQRKEIHGYDGQYTIFMKNKLGDYWFNELLKKEKSSMKGSTAIVFLMERLGVWITT